MPHQNLLACLEDELAAVQSFIALLEDEGKALITRAAPHELAEVTQRKAQAADELAAAGEVRNTELTSLGFETGHAGTAAACILHTQAGPAWQALLEASAQARQLNERNGLLISTHLRFNRDALNALRSAAGATLYGANGKQPAVSNLSTSRQA